MSDMSDRKPRISVFTGHYGSGKTEIAINYALELKNRFARVALVDLDIVNPYFRSREAKEFLAGRAIQVVASAEQCFNTDLPALSRDITGVLKNEEVMVVVDLGGSETGARVMGRFRRQIKDDEYEMLLVVNPFRPFTAGPAGIQSLVVEIEAASRLKVTALVSNPNLGRETTVQDIAAGHRLVREAARATGLPLRFIALDCSLAGSRDLENQELPVLFLKRFMLTPWE